MANEIINEIELLGRCLNGSNDAFGGIVTKYQSLICAITYSATGDMALSEDMAQETFVNAWKNLRQLKDLSKFRAWLCSIARNIILNHLRAEKQNLFERGASMNNFDNVPHNGSEPIDTAISKERELIVRQAIQRIPEEYREPLVLFYREDKSVREVAAQLELSEEAVRTRLSRARLMLKNEVEMMIENTVIRSRPGKAFTMAVMAGIAGIGVGSSSAAACEGSIGSSTGSVPTATGNSAMTAGLAAKIFTAAAIVVVGVGAVVAYKYFTKSIPPNAAIIIQEQKQEPKEIVSPVTVSEEQPIIAAASTTQNTEAPAGHKVNIVDANSVSAVKADTSPVVGGFVRSEDGRPIADVNVQLYWDVNRCMSMVEGRSTVTDANGRWQCKVTQEANDITIRLKHPDYFALCFDYRPSPDELAAQAAVLIMKKGLRISGAVFDAAGNPVPNAIIMPPNSITGTNAIYGIQDSPKTVRTGIAGNFMLKGVKPGRQDIAIDANGYGATFVDVNVVPEMRPLTITLDQGRSLTGVVVDINGVPISEVEVKSDRWQFIRRDGATIIDYKQFNVLRRQTMTDADGYFSIEHLPSIGEVDIYYGSKRPRKFLSASLQIDMAQNEPQTITLYPIPTITGTVIDAQSGKPITKFKVIGGCKWEPNSPGLWNLNADNITSPQGRFSMTKDNFMSSNKKYPGFAAARIEAKGYLVAQTPWMSIDEKFSPVIVSLKKAPIAGATLFDTDGTPLSNSDIFVLPPTSKAYIRNGQLIEGIMDYGHSTLKTGPNGHFELAMPEVSSTILVLGTNGYLVADTNNLKDKLTLIPWAYVSGVVSNEEGGNSNIDVQVGGWQDPNAQMQWFSSQTTNAEGSFAFAYIPAIPQKVYYGPPDSSNSLNKGPDINPGPGEEIELRLGRFQSADANSISSAN
ncbi:MAG: sigma-70 family RNA polymerase sigma factor [Phycisphaerae bacterium]|jgi:RNA polymerase sigma factor (sigma-70 family)